MITIRPLEYYSTFRGLRWNFAGGWVGSILGNGHPGSGEWRIHIHIPKYPYTKTLEQIKWDAMAQLANSWPDPPEWVIDALMKYVNNDQTT